jgi:hypothetical protein
MNHQNQNHKKHMIFMLIGCLAPLLILTILNYLGIGRGTVAKAIFSFGFLLCPLIHIFMIKGLMTGKKCHKQEEIKNKIESKINE